VRLRPPILFTLAYGAGLATGLAHFGDPVSVAACLLAWALRRSSLVLLLATAAVLGRVGGEVAWWREGDRCETRLPTGALRLTVRTLEPIDSAGGITAVEPVGAACVDAVTARWPRRHPLGAGYEVAVVATWVPRPSVLGRPSGTLVVQSVGRAAGQPSLGSYVRNAVAHATSALYGRRAPIVDALVLSRRSGIDRDLRDQFAQSGLVHLLSISGFHVGLIVSWMVLACRLLRLSRSRAALVATAFGVAYVAFLGWPAPATRAAALAAALARCQIVQRRVQANALLSATALGVLLVDPWAIVDLGAWLSVGSMWGATTFTKWTDRTLGTSFWARGLGSSVGATMATAPLTAAALGTVAVIGIVLNFAAIPIAAVAVPGVLASILVFPLWPGLAGALAAGSGVALHLLELAASAGAAIPGGHVIQPAEPRSAIVWTIGLAVALAGIGARATLGEAVRRWGWAAVVALWVGLAEGLAAGTANVSSGLTLHFLDVGQGDAALLRTPAGRWVLIDAGPADERGDAGRSVVVPFLQRAGARKLAVAVVSHAHADHLGGLASVLDRYSADLVIEPAALVRDPLYTRFLGALEAAGIPWHPGRPGDRFELDGVRLTILHPNPSWAGWGEDVNEDSVVLLVEYGAFQALFTGDAGIRAEAALRGRARPVDFLKVGHHGSRGSSGDEWLDSLRPRAALISVGARNRYGHPAPAALARLASHHIAIWRTDRDGTVTVTTDGRTMQVRGRQRSEAYDVQ
jgi:competence protein ComEC